MPRGIFPNGNNSLFKEGHNVPIKWKEISAFKQRGKKKFYHNPIERGKNISMAKKGIPHPNQKGEKNGMWKGGWKNFLPKCSNCGKRLSTKFSKSGLCNFCFPKTTRGENNSNWRGGTISEIERLRYGLEYNIWKLEVYKRDRGICRLCGLRCNNKNIVAHHINNFKDFPELRFSIDNGIVLCRSCHLKIHRTGDDG